VTTRFLTENRLKMVIRSHEVKENGYEVEANGRLITVFRCAPDRTSPQPPSSHIASYPAMIRSSNGRLITVFSAPNYCDQMGNKAAVITFNAQMEHHFTTFEAVPHPVGYKGEQGFGGGGGGMQQSMMLQMMMQRLMQGGEF